MVDFPLAALPETAKPWGRAVERYIKELETKNQNLNSELEGAIQGIGTRDNQLETMRLQIQAICSLAGLPYPPVFTAVSAPDDTPPPPRPTVTTRTFNAQWSATWYQSFKRTSSGGAYDDQNSLYQRGSGYTYSMWRFDLQPVIGKKIDKVEMLLSNVSSYYNGSFTVFLGTHGFKTEPGSRPGGGRVNAWNVGWQTGKSQWIPIDKSLYAALSNGSIQGFTMGDTISDRQNFARFNGVGRPGAPQLRVTYNG